MMVSILNVDVVITIELQKASFLCRQYSCDGGKREIYILGWVSRATTNRICKHAYSNRSPRGGSSNKTPYSNDIDIAIPKLSRLYFITHAACNPSRELLLFPCADDCHEEPHMSCMHSGVDHPGAIVPIQIDMSYP